MEAAYEDIPEAIPGLLLHPTANIESRNYGGETALIVAAQHGRMNSVIALLRAGAAVDGRSHDGRTALHYASRGMPGIVEGNTNRCKTIEILLNAGADINALDIHHATPLYESCCEVDNACAILLLLRNGADVKISDNHGMTALHYLCITEPMDVEAVKMLLVCGANPLVIDLDGDCPMHMAFHGGNAVHGLNSVRVLADMIVFSDLDISTPDEDENTLLHKFDGDVPKFEWLLEMGITMESRNIDGNTPLHSLAGSNEMGCIRCMQLLLNAWVSTNTLNYDGFTARQVAELANHHEVVELLDLHEAKIQERWISVAMGQHKRLGANSLLRLFDQEVLRMVLRFC
ncbi:ankyrin repeat-containing domain protein [Baffinella frigidus]|nr:ankyrin repeat-containing domain protein [Cryptophyta sp. CCMP2293]